MLPDSILLIAAVFGPLGAYLVAARKLSGKVQTSEASDLWEESRSIREALQERNSFLQGIIDKMNERLDSCSDRIDDLEERNQKMLLENGRLKEILESHEQTIRELREHIRELSERNSRLEMENATLRTRVTELEAA